MSDEYVFKPSGALGNILIQLTSMQKECTKLHDSVYEYEFSNCITIKGFTRVSYLGKIPESPIFINPYTIRNVHPRIRDIIEPTSYMEQMIQNHIHLLKDVSCGVSIRRGSYSEDSRQYQDERSDQPGFYHCSDEGLERFRKVIRDAPGKVFISSDSKTTLDDLMQEFGDKLVTLDTTFIIGMSQHSKEEMSIENYQSIYLRFFLFSECPHLFLTGGNPDLVGFSTYAYMAAIYGNKPFSIVFNS